MKHPMSHRLSEVVPCANTQPMMKAWMDYMACVRAAAELDRQRRDIAILCECIEATRNPGLNRVYAECDVAAALERNRCPVSA